MSGKPTGREAQELAAIFRDPIRARFGNQAALAAALKVKASLLSDYLNGKRAIPWSLLIEMARKTDVRLEAAVMAACVVRAKRDVAESPQEGEAEAIRTLESVLQQFQQKPRRPVPAPFRSLVDFPQGFPGEWRVVMGDRRETMPQGMGDLAALSLSTADVMYLPQLVFPARTKVLSDKIFRIADETALRRLLHGNLLMIGSPAVCLGTREIFRRVGSTFLYNISGDDFRQETRLLEEVRSEERHDAQSLARFVERPEIRRSTNALLATFRSNGFVDPTDYMELRGRAIPRMLDYGLIALAPNPWSDEHLVVVCAGVHGPGTAGALQMLSQSDSFSSRPWGGVLKVQVSDQAHWEDRFSHLNPRWETHEYTPEKYLNALNELCRMLEAPEGEATRPHVKVEPAILRSIYQFAAERLHGKTPRVH